MNDLIPTGAKVRKEIWEYLSHSSLGLRLIEIASDIAHGNYTMPSSSVVCSQAAGCPHPLNFLANGEGPSESPLGITSYLPAGFAMKNVFTGSNFGALSSLAAAKSSAHGSTDQELRGFNSVGARGLAVLLGPWTDYCLWCWSRFPDSKTQPTLILGKDNSTLAEENVVSGVDWGAQQIVDTAKVTLAQDKSTQRLFGTMEGLAATKNVTLQEYIAQERIIVVNVWPWFRCGTESSGDQGVHANFGKVPAVHSFLTELARALQPQKVVCTGSWSWYSTRRPFVDEWITRSVRLAGSPALIRSTLHPSARFWNEADLLRIT